MSAPLIFEHPFLPFLLFHLNRHINYLESQQQSALNSDEYSFSEKDSRLLGRLLLIRALLTNPHPYPYLHIDKDTNVFVSFPHDPHNYNLGPITDNPQPS